MNPLDSDPDPLAQSAGEAQPASGAEPPPSPPGLPQVVEASVEAAGSEEVPRKEKEEEKDKGKGKGKERDKEKEKDKERGAKDEDDRPKDKSKKQKQKKKEKDEFRKADPWQRYRALIDTLKESQDLVDLADHKARFALIIMGVLNAAIIILGTRSDFLLSLPPNLKTGLYFYFGIYAVIAIYFLVHAIESLRPRGVPELARKGFVSDKEESLGLRFFVDALRYDMPTYLKAWQAVRVSQLNAELATQLHTLARINKAKYNAVAKLYLGLRAITVLTAGLLVAMAVAAWMDHRESVDSATVAAEESSTAAAEGPAKIKAGKPKKGGWSILGEPERFPVPGVKEPSGIAFAPARNTFFVVGDEGSLVEASSTGRVVASIPSGGNLEDVAIHLPSGRLVLLSEKKSELIVVDPATGKKTGRFRLVDEALLGDTGTNKNQGFEGLTFRAEGGRPGGGVFYLVHQRSPAMLVAVAFDPLMAKGSIGAESLVSRTPVANREDLTAVTFERSLNRLFVIADSRDRLVMLGLSGNEEAEIVLPGAQQEGLSFDPQGNLWIADDRAGLLVFRGARGRIEAEMKASLPDVTPSPKPS